jgi:hypothetical protein
MRHGSRGQARASLTPLPRMRINTNSTEHIRCYRLTFKKCSSTNDMVQCYPIASHPDIIHAQRREMLDDRSDDVSLCLGQNRNVQLRCIFVGCANLMGDLVPSTYIVDVCTDVTMLECVVALPRSFLARTRTVLDVATASAKTKFTAVMFSVANAPRHGTLLPEDLVAQCAQ